MDAGTKSRRTVTSEWVAIISGIITIVTFVASVAHLVLEKTLRWIPAPFEQLMPRDPRGADVIGLVIFGAMIAVTMVTRFASVFIDSDNIAQYILMISGFMAAEGWANIVSNTTGSNWPWFWDLFWYVTAFTALTWLGAYARRFRRPA